MQDQVNCCLATFCLILYTYLYKQKVVQTTINLDLHIDLVINL